MMRLACLCGLFGALQAVGGAVAAQEVVSATYMCDRGARVSAAYINALSPQLVVLAIEGQQVVLTAARSGSGARYQSESDAGYVWITKGAEAIAFWRTGEGGETLLLRCEQAAR